MNGKKHATSKKYLRTWIRIFAFLMVVLLCGCSSGGTREEYLASMGLTEGTSDIPVMAEPDEESRPRVALTFDDGPHNVRSVAIVDELAKYGYHATFFVVGNRVDGSAYSGGKTLRYIVEAGHEIGIHGYTHRAYYDECSDDTYEEEMSKTAEAIWEQLPDYDIRLMRPVGGSISAERVSDSPYSIILWNVDSEDWKNQYAGGDDEAAEQSKAETIVDNVMSTVSEGDIILMHDIHECSLDAVKIILQRLHEEGYEVVTVSELLGEDREAGRKYYSK